MSKKLGNFLLIIGLILLIIFLSAPTKNGSSLSFCFGGVVLLVFAFGLRQMGQEEKPKSDRFKLLRKIFGKD